MNLASQNLMSSSKKSTAKNMNLFERVHIEVPEEYSGTVIEELSRRRGELQHLDTDEHGITSLEFLIPTRGLMGYRNEFPHRHSRLRDSHFDL